MKKVVFHVNHDKPEADAVRRRLTSLAELLGLEIVGGTASAPEAVVVLGGDGTMLSAVHQFPGVPLLGLNLGSLGYLAGVEAPRFEDALRALAAGRFTISARTALQTGSSVALNDIVVARGLSGHEVSIELFVDGRQVTRFSADGLVIATPTGSTAYSLAAGGPILMPDTPSLAVTPICPHALSSRPLVLPDSSCLMVRVRARDPREELAVFADGMLVRSLHAGDAVSVAKSSGVVPLIQLDGYDPYEVLFRKLGWNGSAIK